jgi:hypothetical protein
MRQVMAGGNTADAVAHVAIPHLRYGQRISGTEIRTRPRRPAVVGCGDAAADVCIDGKDAEWLASAAVGR